VKTGVPDMLKVLLILSISNVTWGALTCSWLGMPPDRLPHFLRDISLSYISPAKTEQAIVDQNIQLFCFSLALLHLGIARIGNIVRYIRQRNLKFLAQLGSMATLFGVYNLILFLVVSNKHKAFPVHPIAIYLIIAGVILNFIFSSYDGHLGKSILGGLKNFMSIILSVSNIFSDIMSYIRLWAVGMAGFAVASLVASMTSPLFGSFLVFVAIIVLAFGHGLNMILSVLSVLIHGVRLNILEFSGHAGVSWSGIPYKPFEEKLT
jgi:V/A-type H+-transporting ATPase subunit I